MTDPKQSEVKKPDTDLVLYPVSFLILSQEVQNFPIYDQNIMRQYGQSFLKASLVDLNY